MRGFTLIELIVSLAVMSIILGGGIPSLKSTLDNYQTNISISRLKNTLEKGRFIAIKNTQSIIVCPTKNDECTNDWTQPLIIFHDKNNDLKLDVTDILYLKISNEGNHGYWQKKRVDANYIKFTQEGFAFSSATTFLYCSHSGDTKKAKQLIINFQGRVRLKSYLSGKGEPYSNLTPLSCT